MRQAESSAEYDQGWEVLTQSETKSPVVFLHIPKTAGSSIRHAVQAATGAATAVEGFDLSGFGDAFAGHVGEMPYRSSFYLSPDEFPQHLPFFSGHVALSSLTAAYPHAKLFTVLREPRARILSTWLFWRGFADPVLAPWGEWGRRLALGRGTLRAFLTDRRIACQTDNLCTRMLVWPHPRLPDTDFIPPEADEALLDAARQALERLDFVGCVEDPALAARLGTFIGADVAIDRRNDTQVSTAAPVPALADELDPATLALLGKRSRLDAVLWRSVVRKFNLVPAAEPLAEVGLLHQSLRYVGSGAAYASRAHRAAYEHAALQRAESDRAAAAVAASLRKAREEAAQQAVALAMAHQETAQRSAALAMAHAETARVTAGLRAMEGSTSWRLTAPLRSVVHRLRTRFRQP